MSSPTPDPEFDALMAQTEALRRRYAHATAAEQPSPAIDARIHAAAWQAVGAMPDPMTRSWWHRLRVPVSIAAVLVLTTSAMLSMLHDTGERGLPDPLPSRARTPPPSSAAADQRNAMPAEAQAVEGKVARKAAERDMVASPPERAAPRSSEPLIVALDARPTMADTDGRSVGEKHAPIAAAVAPPLADRAADQPAASAAPPVAAEQVAAPPPGAEMSAGTSERSKATAAAGVAAIGSRGETATPLPATAPSSVLSAKSRSDQRPGDPSKSPPARAADTSTDKAEAAEPLVPNAWLERIRRQWAAGAREEARRDLAAFRRAHPAYPIPKAFPVPVTDTPVAPER